MLDATEPKIRERVNKVRAELAEISRLNEEYRHISHTVPMKEAHSARRSRLELINAFTFLWSLSMTFYDSAILLVW
jgi:hypothetical protein